MTSPVDLDGLPPSSRPPRFVFQALDARRMLQKGRALFFNPGGFEFNKHAGIVIADHVDAVHEGGELFFTSELTVRRFLDLSAFFREATDVELGELFESDTFAVDDWDALHDVATQPIRRKLHGVLTSGAVFSAKKLCAVAKKLGIALTTKKGAVCVPTGRAEFRAFVHLIADDYVKSMLDEGNLYLSSSKRPHNAGGAG